MTKYAGRGLTVAIDGEPAGQLTAFGEVGSSRDLIDASAFGDDWKDYVVAQQDGDEVNFTFAYDPALQGHQDFVAAYDAGDIVTITLAHADAGMDLDVTGIVTALSRGAELGGLLQMSGTFKITNPGVVEGS